MVSIIKWKILKMKNTFTFVLLIALNTILAQNDTNKYYNQTLSKNNFSIELGGKGYLYSIGYERAIYTSKKVLLSGTINLSFIPFVGFDGIILPIGVNVLIGGKKNKLLAGTHIANSIDFTPYPKTKKERQEYRESGRYRTDYYSPPYILTYTAPSLGYRRYFKNNNSISTSFSTLIYRYYSGSWDVIPWFGLNYNIEL